MKHISIEQIVRAVDGQLIGNPQPYLKIKRVMIDSREVMDGDLYIPIIGERFDGHDFIPEAVSKGAALWFSNHQVEGFEGPYVIVKDTRLALGMLAKYYRQQFDIPVIGVTGSVGKTSTKEMLAAILGVAYRVHKTSGNYNNDIGLPLTLLSLEHEDQVAVIELGMNHFGEIDYLGNILSPTHGIITNIGVSHIEFLGSREGILKAKTELLPHIQPNGMIVLNGDDDLLRKVDLTYGLRKKMYGSKGEFDCVLINHQLTDDLGQKITVGTTKGIYVIEVGYPGEHILHNALGCIIVAEDLGLEPDQIVKGIQSYQPAKMRLNLIKCSHQVQILDDCYNASVDSMKSALDTLKSFASAERKTMAILGSMFEMGDYAKKGHLIVGQYAAKTRPDQVLVVGEEARWIGEGAIGHRYPKGQLHPFEDVQTMIKWLEGQELDGYTCLIKASRGMKLEVIRDYLIERFEA